MNEDRIAFVSYKHVQRPVSVVNSNHTRKESGDTEEITETEKNPISTQLFSNVWLTFMCNIAGAIHFYATFREIGPTDLNIHKDDTLFVVNVALCDFFNALGKIFWSYFSIFMAKGKIYVYTQN